MPGRGRLVCTAVEWARRVPGAKRLRWRGFSLRNVSGGRIYDTVPTWPITKLTRNYSFVVEKGSGAGCRAGVIGFGLFGDFRQHFPLVHQFADLPHQRMVSVDDSLSRGAVLVKARG
jgi:hypothetical protein